MSAGQVFVETAVSDHELGEAAGAALVRFYRDDELGGDPSNWFTPTVRTLSDWCTSSGFDVVSSAAWPESAPERASVVITVTDEDPQFEHISYERSLYRNEA